MKILTATFKLTAMILALLTLSQSIYADGKYTEDELKKIRNRALAYEMFGAVEGKLIAATKDIPVGDEPEHVMSRGIAYQAAIKGYSEVLKLHPDYIEAHLALAWVYVRMRTKDAEELAIKHYRESIKLDPAKMEVYHELAYSLVTVKRYEEARKVVSDLTRVHEKRGKRCLMLIEEIISYRKSREKNR